MLHVLLKLKFIEISSRRSLQSSQMARHNAMFNMKKNCDVIVLERIAISFDGFSFSSSSSSNISGFLTHDARKNINRLLSFIIIRNIRFYFN